MKSSNSSLLLIAATLIVALILIISWKILLPDYFQNKSRLILLNNEVSDSKQKLDSIQKAKADLTSIATIKDKIFVAMPEDEDSGNTIAELESICLKNNLVLAGIDLSSADNSALASEDTEQGALASKTRISFSVSGDFVQLSNLIASLEKSIKFMDIISMNLGTDDEGKYNLSLQLDVLKKALEPTSDAVGEEAQ